MFRKQALNFFYNHEKWQSVLQLKSPFNPFLYLLLTLVLSLFVIFLFFGTISTRLNAEGIIIGKNTTIYSAVSQNYGQIDDLLISIGDRVKKGQVIAKLNRLDLTNTALLQRKQLHLLEEERDKLKLQKEQETKIQLNHTKRQLYTLNTIIDFQKKHIAQLQISLGERKKLAEKGVISRLMIEEQERLYNELIKSLNEYYAQILAIEAYLLKFQHQWNEHLLEIDKKILDQQVILQQTEYTLHLASEVKSPISGVITGISTTIGIHVKQGEEIATISPEEDDYDALLFLPASYGQRVKEKMQVLINPAGYPSQETGSILGYVTNVHAFPASKKELDMLLQNNTLSNTLLDKDKSVIIVRARLLKNKNSPNQLQWTSSAGNQVIIHAGSLCSGQFILKQKRPFELIIPAVKKSLGII